MSCTLSSRTVGVTNSSKQSRVKNQQTHTHRHTRARAAAHGIRVSTSSVEDVAKTSCTASDSTARVRARVRMCGGGQCVAVSTESTVSTSQNCAVFTQFSSSIFSLLIHMIPRHDVQTVRPIVSASSVITRSGSRISRDIVLRREEWRQVDGKIFELVPRSVMGDYK